MLRVGAWLCLMIPLPDCERWEAARVEAWVRGRRLVKLPVQTHVQRLDSSFQRALDIVTLGASHAPIPPSSFSSISAQELLHVDSV